jgi:hypothetical protein
MLRNKNVNNLSQEVGGREFVSNKILADLSAPISKYALSHFKKIAQAK